MSTIPHSRSAATHYEGASYPEFEEGFYPEGSSPASADRLRGFVEDLERDASLVEPGRVRERLDALDRLDACLPCTLCARDGVVPELFLRAQAIRERLEQVNAQFYAEIRHRIKLGLRPCDLLRALMREDRNTECCALRYDHVDEVLSGVFQFEEPQGDPTRRDPERLFYQPTAARQIFRLMDLAALTASDSFVDLGSGLGHVPMLVSICTGARSFGIEIERAYVECARACAQGLNLDRVTLVHGDVLEADLSVGTVFYLYTPFMGSVLRAVLDRLRREASTRRIRICSHGPCTPVIAKERWLAATNPPDADSITVFSIVDL